MPSRLARPCSVSSTHLHLQARQRRHRVHHRRPRFRALRRRRPGCPHMRRAHRRRPLASAAPHCRRRSVRAAPPSRRRPRRPRKPKRPLSRSPARKPRCRPAATRRAQKRKACTSTLPTWRRDSTPFRPRRASGTLPRLTRTFGLVVGVEAVCAWVSWCLGWSSVVLGGHGGAPDAWAPESPQTGHDLTALFWN